MGGIVEDFNYLGYLIIPFLLFYGVVLLLIWYSKAIKLNTRLLLTILTFTTPVFGALISLAVVIQLRRNPQQSTAVEEKVE